MVLSRQWKNAIYTPFMLTYSLQQTGGPQATKAMNGGPPPPPSASIPARPRSSVRLVKTDVEMGDEEERAVLLPATHGQDVETCWISSDESSLLLNPADLNESSFPLLASGRRTASPPPLRLSALRRKLHQAVSGATPVNSNYELKAISASSAEEETEGEEETDCASAPLQRPSKTDVSKEEDLYNWMARQQRRTIHTNPPVPQQPQPQPQPAVEREPVQHNNLLVDTRAIFVPLFASVGLETKRSLAEVLSLSGSASVLGGVEELRVEIFESEWSHSASGSSSRRARNKTGNGSRAKNSGTGAGLGHKFTVYIPPDVPAFLCERMAIEIQVKQMSDGEESTGSCDGPSSSTVRAEAGTASENGGAGGGGSFLGQLGLLKPERTTSLNFSLSVGYLAQQVNMPLLRLVHQLGSVYLNAKNTQVQLREQRPLMKRGTDPLRALAVILDATESAPPSPGIRPTESSSPFHHNSSGLEDTGLLASHDTAGRDALVTTAITPSCWRTIYHLLDLYASMTAASTVNKQYEHHPSAPPAGSTDSTQISSPRTGKAAQHHRHRQQAAVAAKGSATERTRLIVFGIMKISRVRLLAMLSGLRLESEIVSLHTSLTYKEKVRQTVDSAGFLRPPPLQHEQLPTTIPRMECSLTGHLGRAMIVLLEVP